MLRVKVNYCRTRLKLAPCTRERRNLPRSLELAFSVTLCTSGVLDLIFHLPPFTSPSPLPPFPLFPFTFLFLRALFIQCLCTFFWVLDLIPVPIRPLYPISPGILPSSQVSIWAPERSLASIHKDSSRSVSSFPMLPIVCFPTCQLVRSRRNTDSDQF